MLQPKDTDWLNGYKNKTHIYAVYKKATSDRPQDTYGLEWVDGKYIFHASEKQKKAGVAVLISDKIDFNIKNIKSSKRKATSSTQGKTHMINSRSFSRNSAGQKGMAGYI